MGIRWRTPRVRSQPTTPAHKATMVSAGSSTAQPVSADTLELARKHVAAYAAPQDGRAAWVVGVTVLLWVGSLLLGSCWFRGTQSTTWQGLALSVCWVFLRAGSLVRVFVMMHDATHNALFSRRWLNSLSAATTGLMTGMDVGDYQRTHSTHHALLGIEEETHRDPDLVVLWTTTEWEAWPRGLSKAAARVMTDPLVLYTVMAPVWILAFNVSWPHRVSQQSPRTRALYVLKKLLVLPFLYAFLIWILNPSATFLWFELLSQQIALSYAMFLYSVEHTYEGVYRVPQAEFNRTAAGLLGSSYLFVPWWWRWATAGVEYHHFHHLNARVPCYRMRECEASAPPGLWAACGVRKLKAREGLRALVLSMWDPEGRCYVPFPEWAWLDNLLKPPSHAHG